MFTLSEPIPRKHQGLRHQRQAVWSCCPEQPWQEQSLPISILYGSSYVNTNISCNLGDLYLIFVNGHQAKAPLLNFSNRAPTECVVCATQSCQPPLKPLKRCKIPLIPLKSKVFSKVFEVFSKVFKGFSKVFFVYLYVCFLLIYGF